MLAHYDIVKVTHSLSNYFDKNPKFLSFLNFSIVKLNLKERTSLPYHNSDLVWNNLFTLQQIVTLFERSQEIKLITHDNKRFYRTLVIAVIIRLFSFEYIVDNKPQLIQNPNNRPNSLSQGLALLKQIDPTNEMDINYNLVRYALIRRISKPTIESEMFKFIFELSTQFISIPLREFSDKRFAVNGIHNAINHNFERNINYVKSRQFRINAKGKIPQISPTTIFDQAVDQMVRKNTRYAIPNCRKILANSYLQEFTQAELLLDTFEANVYEINNHALNLQLKLNPKQKLEFIKRRSIPLLNFKVI